MKTFGFFLRDYFGIGIVPKNKKKIEGSVTNQLRKIIFKTSIWSDVVVSSILEKRGLYIVLFVFLFCILKCFLSTC